MKWILSVAVFCCTALLIWWTQPQLKPSKPKTNVQTPFRTQDQDMVVLKAQALETLIATFSSKHTAVCSYQDGVLAIINPQSFEQLLGNEEQWEYYETYGLKYDPPKIQFQRPQIDEIAIPAPFLFQLIQYSK